MKLFQDHEANYIWKRLREAGHRMGGMKRTFGYYSVDEDGVHYNHLIGDLSSDDFVISPDTTGTVSHWGARWEA